MDLMTSVTMKPDTPEVACCHGHRAGRRIGHINLDPDHQINNGGQVGAGQHPDDGLTSRRDLRDGEGAHSSRLYAQPSPGKANDL